MTTKLYNLEPSSKKVNYFLTLSKDKRLNMQPDFQRRLVWSENSKSYLIDTIIRGLPVPILIVRENVSTKTFETNLEVIDGQQRLNTLIDFVINQNFKLKKIHNDDYGNLKFNELPTDIKERILNYKFSIYELPSSISDTQVLEIFSRLNSTGYKLNKQELRNAKFNGEFGNTVYRISKKFIDMFIDWNLFNINDISRMKEAEFTTDVFVFMIEGRRERKPNLFDSYYKKFDKSFEDSDILQIKYSFVMNSINNILGQDIKNTLFKKESFFYHLFILFYEYHYGKEIGNNILINNEIPKNWKNKILSLSEKINDDDIPKDVIKSFSLGTNNVNSRKIKYNFINEYIYD